MLNVHLTEFDISPLPSKVRGIILHQGIFQLGLTNTDILFQIKTGLHIQYLPEIVVLEKAVGQGFALIQVNCQW